MHWQLRRTTLFFLTFKVEIHFSVKSTKHMLTEPAGLWWLFFFPENTGGTRGGRDLIGKSNIFTVAQFPANFFFFFSLEAELNFFTFCSAVTSCPALNSGKHSRAWRVPARRRGTRLSKAEKTSLIFYFVLKRKKVQLQGKKKQTADNSEPASQSILSLSLTLANFFMAFPCKSYFPIIN